MTGELLGLWLNNINKAMSVNYKESRSCWSTKIDPRIKWGKGGESVKSGTSPLGRTGKHTFLLPLELL